MKIVIVGAGLAGLSAAICFTRRGHDVLVFERQTAIDPKGGGISTRPGATRVLYQWGLREDLAAISDVTPAVIIRAPSTGEIVSERITEGGAASDDLGMMRADLIRLLYRKLSDDGRASIRLGSSIVDIHEDDSGAEVHLADGTVVQGDLVLATDGVRSRLRPKILADVPGPKDLEISNTTLYGVLLDVDRVRAASPRPSRVVDQPSLNVWLGDGCFAVTQRHDKLNQVGLLCGIESDSTDQKGLWDENGDIGHVRRRFRHAACDPDFAAALDIAETCDRWKMTQLPDLPRWSSPGGRVLLLGDSAHAMHPNAAQGYSVTVEDIAVLEHLISLQSHEQRQRQPHGGGGRQGLSAGQARSIASDWEAIRKPRVDRIKAFARWNTDRYLAQRGAVISPRPGSVTRGVVSLADVRPDRDAGFNTSQFAKWTLDYDAIAEADRFLANPVSKLS